MLSIKTRNFRRSFLLLITFLSMGTLNAAQFDSEEYINLATVAAQNGSVRVMVTLEHFTLDEIAENLDSIRADTNRVAESVLSELGGNALLGGSSHNGIGQLVVNVNEAGLQALVNNPNVLAISRDTTHELRIKAVTHDGSIDAIESQFENSNVVAVEIFMNSDEVDYDLSRAGSTEFYPRSGMPDQVSDRLAEITNKIYASGITVIGLDSRGPIVQARITKSAFYGLIEDINVRAVRPIGYRDSRPAHWPIEAIEAAARDGQNRISIALRGGEFYTPKTGYMSEAAIDIQAEANRRAFSEIFADANISLDVPQSRHELALGSATLSLSESELRRLYGNADERILSIDRNDPVQVTLDTSTAQINVASAWASGFRGAGQHIAIFDTGVRKSHVYFEDSTSPFTMVINEACYGTNTTISGTTYTSPCPNQNVVGDSVVNEPGAGEPYGNAATCAVLVGPCAHGSHVAGIAAGRTIPPNTLVQGVAPDAFVAAFQLASFSDNPATYGIFRDDLVPAIDAIWGSTVPGTSNPFTVNMSIGGGTIYTADCDTVHSTVTSGVHSLISRGVPVTISTGNGASRTGITWPACISQSTKVSGVENDLFGTTIYSNGNYSDPTNYTGPMFLAPSGGGSTFVWSARNTSDIAEIGMQGTSQAAPHVAGVYALLKEAVPGISVADATAWIQSTGSIGVTFNLGAPHGNITFRRIEIP